MHRSLIAAAAVLVAALNGFAGENKDAVQLDYTVKPQWQYALTYQATCVFDEKDAKKEKTTKVNCTLDGTLAKEKDKVDFTIKDLEVDGDLYEDEVIEKLTTALTSKTHDLPLVDGQPSVAQMADLSSQGVPEWNLYIQFAKLLPEMPKQAPKKGLTWERSGEFEMNTAQGQVPCEVYRQFAIDKLSESHDTAYVSWQFKYAAAKPKDNDSTLLKYVPVAGKGRGSAVVDLAEGYIVKATMDFATPVAKIDKAKVSWKETASISLKSGK